MATQTYSTTHNIDIQKLKRELNVAGFNVIEITPGSGTTSIVIKDPVGNPTTIINAHVSSKDPTKQTLTTDAELQQDLHVDGSDTNIESQTVVVGDSTVLLNSELTGVPPTSLESGIEVERGSSTNTKLVWKENEDAWHYVVNGTYYSIFSLDGAVQIPRDKIEAGTLDGGILFNAVPGHLISESSNFRWYEALQNSEWKGLDLGANFDIKFSGIGKIFTSHIDEHCIEFNPSSGMALTDHTQIQVNTPSTLFLNGSDPKFRISTNELRAYYPIVLDNASPVLIYDATGSTDFYGLIETWYSGCPCNPHTIKFDNNNTTSFSLVNTSNNTAKEVLRLAEVDSHLMTNLLLDRSAAIVEYTTVDGTIRSYISSDIKHQIKFASGYALELYCEDQIKFQVGSAPGTNIAIFNATNTTLYNDLIISTATPLISLDSSSASTVRSTAGNLFVQAINGYSLYLGDTSGTNTVFVRSANDISLISADTITTSSKSVALTASNYDIALTSTLRDIILTAGRTITASSDNVSMDAIISTFICKHATGFYIKRHSDASIQMSITDSLINLYRDTVCAGDVTVTGTLFTNTISGDGVGDLIRFHDNSNTSIWLMHYDSGTNHHYFRPDGLANCAIGSSAWPVDAIYANLVGISSSPINELHAQDMYIYCDVATPSDTSRGINLYSPSGDKQWRIVVNENGHLVFQKWASNTWNSKIILDPDAHHLRVPTAWGTALVNDI